MPIEISVGGTGCRQAKDERPGILSIDKNASAEGLYCSLTRTAFIVPYRMHVVFSKKMADRNGALYHQPHG
jgi:hypothetical protein